ncbi:protein LTO1 homolog isoform X5 [Zalophus californianus]|uniref:Protein LTO1 homolog isoform X5 n=1 Tax=Zalophus californianus TaxID=9704 RepID=A0A6J2BRP3_ZALCA|nr:protein LTO1 homolog isoform X5 [Zalophus californianus]
MAGSQDMFDAIVMADERWVAGPGQRLPSAAEAARAWFHGEGYQEGYEEGNSLGMIEGRQYGTLHGAKIGSEIGCYQGFAFAWRCLLHSCTTEKDSVQPKHTQTKSAHPPETLADLLVTGQTPLCSPDLPPAFGL